MSKPTYRYENSFKFLKKGVMHTVKEQVIDGPKGLTIMFLKKIGDEFYKLYAVEKEKGSYEIKEKINDKESTNQVDDKGLLKMLKSEKLEGVINYVTKERGTYKNRKISLSKNLEKAAML
jgi:hypothetical protein